MPECIKCDREVDEVNSEGFCLQCQEEEEYEEDRFNGRDRRW